MQSVTHHTDQEIHILHHRTPILDFWIYSQGICANFAANVDHPQVYPFIGEKMNPNSAHVGSWPRLLHSANAWSRWHRSSPAGLLSCFYSFFFFFF